MYYCATFHDRYYQPISLQDDSYAESYDSECYYIFDKHEHKHQNIINPIAIYIGFWIISLGTFAYSYCKIKNYNNKFCNVIDNCLNGIIPSSDTHQNLIDDINKFDINTLKNINPNIQVTDSDEEYLTELNDAKQSGCTIFSNGAGISNNILDKMIKKNQSRLKPKLNQNKITGKDCEKILNNKNTKDTSETNIINIKPENDIVCHKTDNIPPQFKKSRSTALIYNKSTDAGTVIDNINVTDLGYDLIDSDNSE